ncbi:hypothetical protein EDD29_5728 [Actinocorallia herbida]|uniref:PAP2 superfamily protein n=1 Tax=Actinocorallia herbida TaxID=58109 RepID=A0A3N1D3H1_9ACTN|nr:phosphoesterase PA-phosphatase [Actinocorallia herbida]ROO88072.1 hypothetical protein EDD29_5728 [Actinocorallia herbida]
MSEVKSDRAAPDRSTSRERSARIITEIFAPWTVIVALFLTVGFNSGDNGLAWGLAGAFFCSIAPMLVILAGVLVGRYADHHLTTRRHRLVPLILAITLVLLGIAVLHNLNAPADILTTQTAILTGGLVGAPITALWKISFHTGVAAAAATVLVLLYGTSFLALSPLLLLIAWARTALTHHTTAQVLTAIPIGALAAALPLLLTH